MGYDVAATGGSSLWLITWCDTRGYILYYVYVYIKGTDTGRFMWRWSQVVVVSDLSESVRNTD